MVSLREKPTSSVTSSVRDARSGDLPQWQPATWDDYLRLRNEVSETSHPIFFNDGYLWIDMSTEGINHAGFNSFMGIVFFLWFSQKTVNPFHILNGCLMERPGFKGASPDLMLYVGEDYPQRAEGESRYLNLDQWRVPDLVGEVGDTTIATDLDEKKQLYAAIGIPEYWVVDVKASRLLAFRLDETSRYQQIETSIVLEGLPIVLLDQALAQLNAGKSNGEAAQGFAKAISDLD